MLMTYMHGNSDQLTPDDLLILLFYETSTVSRFAKSVK